MQNKFLSKDKISIHTSKFTDILLESKGYEDLHNRIKDSDLEYSDHKVYEVAASGFIDFNQHLYEDINHMNSISTGIYLEMSLITFKILIWGSKGEGFEIFRHVLRGEEIDKLKTIEDIKEYLCLHMNELEAGITKTYNEDTVKSFEQFGLAIESKKLPLSSILQFLTIENNINDFR